MLKVEAGSKLKSSEFQWKKQPNFGCLVSWITKSGTSPRLKKKN